MKKNATLSLLFICLPALTLHLLAQPVIVNTMVPFPVGTSDSIYAVAASIAPGGGGAGITWDFSSLVPVAQASITVVTPSSTPYFSTFPTTTFCAKITPIGGSSAYMYERITATKWEQLANNYAGPGIGDDYTPNPESSIEFPMNYLDSFIDTFQKTTGGPNPVTVSYDGYGTLITPFATYTNVVRIKKYWGPGDYAYNWYVTAPNLSIIADYDATGNSYSFLKASATTGIKEGVAGETAQLYPNPLTENAILKLDLPEGVLNCNITVTDAIGRIVKQIPVNGAETTINRDGLSPGIYLYNVINNGMGIVNGRLLIQ